MDVEKIERELVKKALTQKLYLAQLQVLQNSFFWKKLFGVCWTTRSMRLPQNYVHFHWSMFWELTIAFSNPSCPTLKFWFWLTYNFLKTRFFQKAHFKGPWKARSKGLANDESKNLLLISPGLLSEKVEVEEKSAQPQLFDQGRLQFYRNLFFWKNWYYASLESAKHVLSEYAIKCYFAGFTRASQVLPDLYKRRSTISIFLKSDKFSLRNDLFSPANQAAIKFFFLGLIIFWVMITLIWLSNQSKDHD